MPSPTNRFESTLRDLEQAVAAIRRFSNEPLDKSLLTKACADAQRCLSVFGDVLEERSTSSLESFFSAVGAGVISAQRELDQHSLAYIQDAMLQQAQALTPKGDKAAGAALGAQLKHEGQHGGAEEWNTLALPPNAAMFRIPKVTAEFKFAVEQTLTKGINVIFYSNKVESQSLQQQTATIEVVSVPLPPNYRPPPPDAAPVRLAEDKPAASPPLSPSRPAEEVLFEKVRGIDGRASGTSPAATPPATPPATATPPAGPPKGVKPASSSPPKPVIFTSDGGDEDASSPDAAAATSQKGAPARLLPLTRAVEPAGQGAPMSQSLATGPSVELAGAALTDPFVQIFARRVLDEGSRRDLFARLVPSIQAMGAAGFLHGRLLSKSVQARTVILEDEQHRYFLLLARGQPQPLLRIWQFSLSPPQLQQIVRLRIDPQAEPGLSHVCQFVERLGSEQAALRSRHGR